MQPRRSIVRPSMAGGWAGCLAGVMLAPSALVLDLLIERQLPPRGNDERTALIYGLCSAPFVGGVVGAIFGAGGGLVAGLTARRDVGVLGGAAVGGVFSLLLMLPAGEWKALYTTVTGLCGAAGGARGGSVMRRTGGGTEGKGDDTNAINN